MTEASTRPQIADAVCEDCGYQPQLKRTLGSFQVFAVSFAFISVAVGIFGTYDQVLRNGGAARDLAVADRRRSVRGSWRW